MVTNSNTNAPKNGFATQASLSSTKNITQKVMPFREFKMGFRLEPEISRKPILGSVLRSHISGVRKADS